MSRSNARKQFLLDVFTTAVEGGVDYWAQVMKYHWSIDGAGVTDDLDGFFAVVRPHDDGNERQVDARVIAHGLRRMRDLHSEGKLGSVSGHDYHKDWIRADRTNGAEGDFDADMADQVVQLGLFDKLVYG